MWDGAYAHTRPDQVIQGAVVSAGTFTGFIGPVPEGFCWYVERLTCFQSGGATTNAVLEVYVSQAETAPTAPDKTGRQDVALAAVVGNGVSDEQSPIYVGPGQYLVGSWSGLTSADRVALTTQIRVHELLRHRGPHDVPRDEKLPTHDKAPEPGIVSNALAETAHLLADVVGV